MGEVTFKTETEIAAEKKRGQRNNLLKQEVDQVTPLVWDSLTETERDEWRTYRQSLLDIPQNSNFPDIALPAKPSTIDLVKPSSGDAG